MIRYFRLLPLLSAIALLALVLGCAEQQPATYYVHMSEDRELERHLAAASEAMDDFEVELAKSSLEKACIRLEYMVMARFSARVTSHYAERIKSEESRLATIMKTGVPVRVAFNVGYDPEIMDPIPEGLKLGDLQQEILRIPYHRRVEIGHQVLYYTQGSGRNQYNIYLRRLAPYRNHILRVFRSHGLPEELMCVAMIESAGDPTRVSPANAAGMWQFIPQTARNYGLLVNDSVDQRFDPILETYAAARYLKFLLESFDQRLETALAAYNAGEGFIAEVMAHPEMQTLWVAPFHGDAADSDLPSIPKETYDYIARFYAVAIVYQNLERFGFELPPAPEDPFILVRVTGQAEVSSLERDMGVAADTLVGMNPSLKSGTTPDGESVTLRLPPESPEVYANRLRQAQKYRISFVYRHKVTNYQTLRSVAEKYGVSALRIADVNDLGQENRLEAGSIIRIPTTAGNSRAVVAAAENLHYWRTFKDTLWDTTSN